MSIGYNEEIGSVMRLHYNSLQEKDCRRYAAVEAMKLGRGGVTYISKLLVVDRNTIIEGRNSLHRMQLCISLRTDSAAREAAEKKG